MKKVLIVNDDSQMLPIYVKLFVYAGYTVRQAVDPQEIINVLIKERMDAVILDLKISAMDFQLIRDLLEAYDPNLKVVVIKNDYKESTNRITRSPNNDSEKLFEQFVLAGRE